MSTNSSTPSPAQASAEPILLSAASVARLLDTTPLVVRRLARSGRFPPPIKTHRKLARWHRTTVLNWIEKSATSATSAKAHRRRDPAR